ncbi:MAG: hypothetical protein ABIZ81_05250 [Opitutaceae bacterium]
MRFSSALRFTIRVVSVLAVLPAAVQAHPGHDGHELTWDLGHLAAFPLATVGCFLAIAGLGWTAGRVLRSRTPAARKIKSE